MLDLLFTIYLRNVSYDPTVQAKVCQFAETRLDQIQTDFSHKGLHSTPKPLTGIWYENLAKNFKSEKKVYRAWRKSKPHNKILNSDMTYACLVSENKHWVLIGFKPLK